MKKAFAAMARRCPSRRAAATQFVRAGTIAALLGTAACGHKAPSGQTVATVNGDDVTMSELNFELGAAGVPRDQADKARAAVLQSLIDRKLLVQQAEKDKLDKDPDVILADRRARDILLAQKMMQSALAGLRQNPTRSEINSYLDKHAGLGASRRVLLIDQIKFEAPATPAQAQALSPLKTMDQLAQYLQSQNKPMERTTARADTGTIPDDLLGKLLRTQGGEPLVVVQGPIATANIVIGTEAAPANWTAADKIASQQIVDARLRTAMQQRQDALRQGAQISYAPGMAPPPAPKPKG